MPNSGWTLSSRTLTLPPGAGPGDPRIVIGPDLPPPLDTFTWAAGTRRYRGGIIFYGAGDDTTYTYLCVASDSLGAAGSGILHMGQVDSGAVLVDDAGAPQVQSWDFNAISGVFTHSFNPGTWHAEVDTTGAAGNRNEITLLGSGASIVCDDAGQITLSTAHGIISIQASDLVNSSIFVNGGSLLQMSAQALDLTIGGDTNLYRSGANRWATDDRFDERPMQAIYARNAAAPIASGGAGAVGTYDTTVADFWGIGNVAGVFTIPAGWGGSWRVATSVQFSLVAAPAGFRLLQIRKNGGVIAESRPGANLVANQPTGLGITIDEVFAAGDTVDAFLFQNQGVALNYGGAGAARFNTSLTYNGRTT